MWRRWSTDSGPRPQTIHAQATLKVYVQQAKDKHWTDIQGTEIVGFSCATVSPGVQAACFVASC
jgi:hypothetical protein